jgi:hypothetical protein
MMKKVILVLNFAILWVITGCGQEVKMVEVEPSSINFTKPTQSQKIKAKALEIRGAEIPGVPITFRSENTAVATVNSSGVVKPAGNGSTAIIAEAANGVDGEAFVKVCLPKEIICDPPQLLTLRVGTAGPIKCHVTNCKDEKIQVKIDYIEASKEMLFKDGENTFVGKMVGDTSVTIKSMGLEKTVNVHIDEQIFSPGMGPGSGGGGGHHSGGGGKGKSKNPYKNNGGGRYDHIIGNMSF